MLPELACHEEPCADDEYTPNAAGETDAEAAYAGQSNEDEDTDIKFCHCWGVGGVASYEIFKKGISFSVSPKVCLIAGSTGLPPLS